MQINDAILMLHIVPFQSIFQMIYVQSDAKALLQEKSAIKGENLSQDFSSSKLEKRFGKFVIMAFVTLVTLLVQ